MKKITVSILTILTSLALMSPLYAAPPAEMHRPHTYYQKPELERGVSQSESQRGMSQSESQLQSEWRSESHTAEEILGLPVVAQDGEQLGEIRNISLDTRTGRINYVTIQRDEGISMVGEEESIAVPLEAFRFTKENAILTVDKNKLENAPRPPEMTDREFRRDLETHYGISPVWQEPQDRPENRY